MLEHSNIGNLGTIEEAISLALRINKNARAPIQSIPSDILVEIFEYLITESEEQWYKIMWVCRDWRIIAMGVPSFWTNVELSATSFVLKDPDYLARSNGLPLSIRYSARAREAQEYRSHHTAKEWEAHDLAKKELYRTRSLEVKPYKKVNFQDKDFWDISVPVLNRLIVRDIHVSPGVSVFSKAPALSSLTLINTTLKLGHPENKFRSLTELRLQNIPFFAAPHISTLLEYICQIPSLRVFVGEDAVLYSREKDPAAEYALQSLPKHPGLLEFSIGDDLPSCPIYLSQAKVCGVFREDVTDCHFVILKHLRRGGYHNEIREIAAVHQFFDSAGSTTVLDRIVYTGLEPIPLILQYCDTTADRSLTRSTTTPRRSVEINGPLSFTIRQLFDAMSFESVQTLSLSSCPVNSGQAFKGYIDGLNILLTRIPGIRRIFFRAGRRKYGLSEFFQLLTPKSQAPDVEELPLRSLEVCGTFSLGDEDVIKPVMAMLQSRKRAGVPLKTVVVRVDAKSDSTLGASSVARLKMVVDEVKVEWSNGKTEESEKLGRQVGYYYTDVI